MMVFFADKNGYVYAWHMLLEWHHVFDNQFRNCMNFIPRQIQCSEGVETGHINALSGSHIAEKSALKAYINWTDSLSLCTVLLKATPLYTCNFSNNIMALK